jgi:hypothetical protein
MILERFSGEVDPVHREKTRDIHLVLPETGVCSTGLAEDEAEASPGCCGGPAPSNVDACCVAEAKAEAERKDGCGCGSSDAPVRRASEKVAEPGGCC